MAVKCSALFNVFHERHFSALVLSTY